MFNTDYVTYKYKLLNRAQETELGKLQQRGQRAAHMLKRLPHDHIKYGTSQRYRNVRQLLLQRVMQGQEARDQLVRCNHRLVVQIARCYYSRSFSLEDMISEGSIGLIRAAERYDPIFGTRFSIYAAYWIKQAISSALISAAPIIRLPPHIVAALSKWSRAHKRLAYKLNREPYPEEIWQHMGLKDDQYELIRIARMSRSRDNSDYIYDGICDESQPDIEIKELQEYLATRMKKLDERSIAVLRMRFGIDGEPMTLQQIGNHFGVTRETAGRIEKRAIRRLQEIA